MLEGISDKQATRIEGPVKVIDRNVVTISEQIVHDFRSHLINYLR